MAWRRKPQGTIFVDTSTQFNVIKNTLRFWAADPFIFQYGGDTYIFAELYDYTKCRGGLGYCKWNGKSFGRWKKVISEKYHLSYPYIFEKNGQVYLIPESGAARSLCLYRATEFPDKWEKVSLIRDDVVYADTTPFEFLGHRYAFTYDVSDEQKYVLLLLDLDNEENDLKLDNLDYQELRRPAGNVFNMDNKLIRPAQNCINQYGEGLVFYSCEFKDSTYQEKTIMKMFPQELQFSDKMILDGMHTYNATETFEVIDIKTRRLNIINLFFRILDKIRRRKG